MQELKAKRYTVEVKNSLSFAVTDGAADFETRERD
jgi:hypothetical protein